jgi:predicted PurR-regulated permease PerM
MNADIKKIPDAVIAIIDGYQKRPNELQAIFAPTWNARADTLKTIVSLSSASIVLSVTFSSSLRQLNVGSAWRYLIVSSFVLFTTSLITAIFALWWGARLYRLQSLMVDQRLRMYKAIKDSKSEDEIVSSLHQISDEVLKPIYDTDNKIAVLYGVSGICFCIAIILLAIVGTARLI